MIALLHGATAWGAVERYAAALARGLKERGEEAIVVYPDAPELLPFGGIGVRTHTFPGDLAAPRLTLRLRRLLRQLRPRAVHVIDLWPPAIVAARLARVPRTIVTHHTPELPRDDNLVGRAWLWTAWALRPEVIYTSETDRRTDARRDVRTHVIELGIDLDRFSTGTRVVGRRRPVIGNVARVVEQKGQRTLIDAAALVPEADFVIVGDGELRGELERHAREVGVAGRVTFTGARDDVPDLLASFDVFAFPSHFEGLCLAVIEAQAAGVPVVATPVGGIRETVVDDETGLVVPPGDAQALALAIRRLLDDPERARRLAEEARRRVRERFSEQRMVERTLELYENAPENVKSPRAREPAGI